MTDHILAALAITGRHRAEVAAWCVWRWARDVWAEARGPRCCT